MSSNRPEAQGSKRKQPSNGQQGGQQSSKRTKSFNAHAILAQTSDTAIRKNGELDVAAFVRARNYEIQALETSMVASKHSLSTRAFQQVPRSLRRRTASHNVKKVPKRLRARAAKEMRDDNTPTVTTRTRKLTGKQRLRAEQGKLKVSGASHQELDRELQEKVGAADRAAELAPSTKTKAPINELRSASPTVPKFSKRQLNKQWLPTHLWHAKRAHMTPPKEPLWRFAIPLTPTEKSYRMTHRASVTRGCVAWDMSYINTIGLTGVESSLRGVLHGLGVPTEMFEKKGQKWRNGSRSWSGWMRETDHQDTLISPVTILWCGQGAKGVADQPRMSSTEDAVRNDLGSTSTSTSTSTSKVAGIGTMAISQEDSAAGHGDLHKENAQTESNHQASRMLMIRVHPAAFLRVWEEILKISKLQRPHVTVEDLRFDIGSIDITGPASLEALAGCLRPTEASTAEPSPMVKLWKSIASATQSASLPADVLFTLDISDPRLRFPPQKVDFSHTTPEADLLTLLSSWPIDQDMPASSLFDRQHRRQVANTLLSQKSINRRKSEAPPGDHSSERPSDPKIPVILLSLCPPGMSGVQGTWTMLLPWKCVLPIWHTLMYHPLSTGGNPRFGGLQEHRQISFERCTPYFPGDYPGIQAGWDWELWERARRKASWEQRPKSKRIAWDSIDLGHGHRGEIGLGWACDWERLFEDDVAGEATADQADSKPKDTRRPVHVPLHMVSSTTHLTRGIISIKIIMIQTGVPKTCARIYRLPTENATAHAHWLALASAKPTTTSTIPSIPEERPATAHPSLPGAEDLIGFVTTGNFNLGEGRGTGIGCIALKQVRDQLQSGHTSGLCIIRESGMNVGRIARWFAT